MFKDKYEQDCTVSQFDKNIAFFFLPPYSTHPRSVQVPLAVLVFSLEARRDLRCEPCDGHPGRAAPAALTPSPPASNDGTGFYGLFTTWHRVNHNPSCQRGRIS